MSWYGTKKASKLPDLDKSKILVFDVETTGLSSVLDEIVQITILDGYGSVLFSSYIRPTRHKIWVEAQRINGINYSLVKNAPTIRTVKKDIQKIFNNAKLVVGYNVEFDIEFIEAAGIIVSGTHFDVMTAFASYRAGVERAFYRKCRLTECAEYFGYSFNPHDSLEDARATLYCFDSMINDDRFTAYKRKERKQLQKEKPAVKKRTHFTLTFQGGFFRAIIIGLILIAIGMALLVWLGDIKIDNQYALQQMILFVKENAVKDPKIALSCLLVVIGTIMIAVRLIRKVIMIPKWIINCIKKPFDH